MCRQILLKALNFKRHEVRQIQITLTHVDGWTNERKKKHGVVDSCE